MRTWLRIWEQRLGAPSVAQRQPYGQPWSSSLASGAPWLPIALVILSLALVFGRALVDHIRLSANSFAFNDDARQQIYPFLARFQPGLFPNDYAARYYLACFPLGFRAFYTLLASIVDPILVSKVVPYLLFGVILVALGYASYRLSGWLGCWFTLAFTLSSPYFLARVMGGLPRGFGLALLACSLAALVHGRMRLLAVLTVLSAAFYAPGAVLGGLCLAAVTLLSASANHGDVASWSTRKRLLLVVVTMLSCVAVLIPTLLGSLAYGSTLGPSDVAAYPELGPEGRYGPEDRAPFDALPRAILKMLPEAFRGREATWLPGTYDWVSIIPSNPSTMPLLQWVMLGVGLVVCVGLVLQAYEDAAARRLLVLPIVASIAYLVATPLAPTLYLPQRYTAYTIPLVAVVGLPAACRTLANLAQGRNVRGWRSGIVVIGVCGATWLYTGGTGNRSAGLVQFEDGNAAIYQFVASTPPDTVFAAWPSELANNIPYFSHRSILMNAEVHQVFHTRYADEMRARTYALIDAYLAADVAPIRTLREQYGVRYLIVDERHFTAGVPPYFEPYNERIRIALAKINRNNGTSAALQLTKSAVVFRDGPFVVLDLERIGSP